MTEEQIEEMFCSCGAMRGVGCDALTLDRLRRIRAFRRWAGEQIR